MTPTLDDLLTEHFALCGIVYGPGIAKPLGLFAKAGASGEASHRAGVTGHPPLTQPQGRDISRSTARREGMLRDRETICRGGGWVESLQGKGP